MSTYLLLRNNKESGPYSANDLKALGLKPYDLVWLNGKSAAWRYPGELEELKSFAPAIEEQPFDRFYKKLSPQDKTIDSERQEPVQANTNNRNESLMTGIKEPGEPIVVNAGGKKVFVSLPQNEKSLKHTPGIITVEKTSAEDSTAFANYLPSEHLKQPGSVPELEKKFSQPLDEIKDMYVQTLVERKKKMARKTFAKQNLKKAGAFATVLIAGVVLGLAFQNKNKIDDPLVSQKVQEAPAYSDQHLISRPEEQEPLAKEEQPITTQTELKQNEPSENIEKAKPAVAQLPQQKGGLKTEIIKTEEKRNDPVKDEKTENTNAIIAIKTDPVTGERKKAVRTDSDAEPTNTSARTTMPKSAGTESLLKQVSLKTSNYKTGPFGGIRDLNLTLVNNSQTQMDEVEVEVKYFGFDRTIVKSQKMVFHDIPSHGQVRSDVPKSNRGISVECVITKINAKETGVAQTGL